MARTMPEMIRQMMQRGWTPGPAISLSLLETIEVELNIALPDDYRAFHELTGGAGRDEKNGWRGLWPIDHLITLNRRYPVFQWFPGLVGFANESFILYAFDFRQPIPPVVSLGLSSSDWSDVDHDSPTFSDWLETSLTGR